ncbi:glycosyltransferase [Fidelibacter multiformis]
MNENHMVSRKLMPKVLMITYYWPPAGGPGVQRLVKWVHLLPEYGWEPLVLTVKHGDYPALDPGLVREIPQNLKVFYTKTVEPFGLYKRMTGKGKEDKIPTYVLSRNDNESLSQKFSRWIRANFFIPDARRGWNPFLKRAGRRIILREKPDVILSSSPPHSLQIATGKLARLFRLPWIVDLRDPWTEAFWEKDLSRTVLSEWLNRRYERQVLKKATAVITVSPGLVDMFKQKAENHYHVIHNGFTCLNGPAEASSSFTILYAGTLSKFQDPGPLLEALLLLPDKLLKMMKLRFIGKVYDAHKVQIEHTSPVPATFEPYMPHDKMMEEARSAALLLKIQAQSGYSDKSIGAKMYDYLAMRKPILVIGGKRGVIESMVAGTGSGEVFSEQDVPGIADFLTRWIQIFEKEPVISLPVVESLNQYKTPENVRNLSEIMYKVTQRG